MQVLMAVLSLPLLIAGTIALQQAPDLPPEQNRRRIAAALGMYITAAALITGTIAIADTALWLKGFGLSTQAFLAYLCARCAYRLRRNPRLILTHRGLQEGLSHE